MIVRSLSRLAAIVTVLVLSGRFSSAAAQVQATPGEVLTLARGTSALITSPTTIQRVSIGDPAIADAVVVSPNEVLVNAKALGTTTLIVWDNVGGRRLFNVEVNVDVEALLRRLRTLFPGENINITSSGNILIVSGRVSDAGIAARVLEIARGTGATVIQNLNIPPARQILLRVRFAEVTRRAGLELGTEFSGGRFGGQLTPESPENAREGENIIETFSDGLVRLFLFEENIQINAVIQALQERGIFRSLAEPNLLALEGEEASFLAGGEFPYPIPQTGQGIGGVTIAFKEFGIRLRFTPQVTLAGNVRLAVAPEVSQLDFANGLQFSGFLVPSLLTRRAETEIELRPGQTFAIAGLMDNRLQRNAGKIPFLGDLPILGPLFQSRDVQENRTELLVLVTPIVMEPSDTPPPLPTGEPREWDWSRPMRVPDAPVGAP